MIQTVGFRVSDFTVNVKACRRRARLTVNRVSHICLSPRVQSVRPLAGKPMNQGTAPTAPTTTQVVVPVFGWILDFFLQDQFQQYSHTTHSSLKIMSSDATQGQAPDVYGQVHPVETPDLLETKRAELEEELRKIPMEEKIEWMEAQAKCGIDHPDLVGDDFKLQFLRCEVFNADVSTVDKGGELYKWVPN